MLQNTIAIVGKPNVGKSALFNRLIGKRHAIVENYYGVTRDRIYGHGKWLDYHFQVIDTGGIEIADHSMQQQIKIQVQIAISEAQSIIFVVDNQIGITNDDLFVMQMLRKTNKNIFIVANKAENSDVNPAFYAFGESKIFAISALHGNNIGNLLDSIVSNFEKSIKSDSDDTKIAIVGRPNAGKSSLLNSLVNQNRAIVSSTPGTTRDAIDSAKKIFEKQFIFTDTAGIIKKSKLVENIEHYALIKAMSAISQSDLCLLTIDATKPFAHFDSRIIGYVLENDKPLILVINKWDLVSKDTNSMDQYIKKIHKTFKFIPWAPVEFISALKRQRLIKLEKLIYEVADSFYKQIKTSLLNEILIDAQIINPPSSFNGGKLQIKFIKQVHALIPTFILFVNNPKFLHFSYKRHLENLFRKYFEFKGLPIKLIFKKNK